MASSTGWKLLAEHPAPSIVSSKLAGLGFDHQHRIANGGDHQIEVGLLLLLERRVEHELAIEDADAGRADRPHERMPDKVRAADEAIIATTSGSFSRSCDSTVAMSWVSFL